MKNLCFNNETGYIDFHTHLDWYNPEDELISQLKTFNGIIVAASCDDKSFEKNLQLEQSVIHLEESGELAPGTVKILPTFGIHPMNAAKASSNLSVYDSYCNQSFMIGEIGMDFCWYKDASEARQEEVFRYFLQHCHESKKYCVIHTKDAEEKICRILEEYPDAKPIIHWYDGPEDVFKEMCRRNYYQTFGCQTIRSKSIQQLLQITPKNLILCETDNPSSEPWLGGTDNSIFLIQRIYKDLASLLKMNLDDFKKMVNQNARKIIC